MEWSSLDSCDAIIMYDCFSKFTVGNSERGKAAREYLRKNDRALGAIDHQEPLGFETTLDPIVATSKESQHYNTRI